MKIWFGINQRWFYRWWVNDVSGIIIYKSICDHYFQWDHCYLDLLQWLSFNETNDELVSHVCLCFIFHSILLFPSVGMVASVTFFRVVLSVGLYPDLFLLCTSKITKVNRKRRLKGERWMKSSGTWIKILKWTSVCVGLFVVSFAEQIIVSLVDTVYQIGTGQSALLEHDGI